MNYSKWNMMNLYSTLLMFKYIYFRKPIFDIVDSGDTETRLFRALFLTTVLLALL